MEKVEAFRANDGALFSTPDEAAEHEISLVWRARVEEFANTPLCPYPNGAHRGMVNKIIVAWERFKIEYKSKE